MGQRDTLVLPILYNARHGLELALKFSTKQLMAADLLKDDGTYKANHNIKALWQRLHDTGLGDTKLVTTIASLKPFIESLSGIDEDGQELRYHENRDNDKSLDKYALANLEVIQASLVTLKDLIDDLKYRTMDYIDEAVYGIVTKTCSRAICWRLPRRSRPVTNGGPTPLPRPATPSGTITASAAGSFRRPRTRFSKTENWLG
jgi:hypothetical protein